MFRKAFAYKLFGVPTTAVALFVFAVTVVGAAWIGMRSSGNVLGSSYQALEYSADDGTTWSGSPPTFFDAATLTPGDNQYHIWNMRVTSGSAPSQISLTVDNITRGQGSGLGAGTTNDFCSYLQITAFNQLTPSVVDLTGTLTDYNANGWIDLADFEAGAQAVNFADGEQYSWQIDLRSDVTDHEDTAGDSCSGWDINFSTS